MDQVVELYGTEEHPSLQSIAEETSLNPIKVRKLLIIFPEDTDSTNISVDAERIRRMRKRNRAVKMLQEQHNETRLWECIVAF